MTPTVDTFIANIQQCGYKVPNDITSMIDDIATKAIKEMSKKAGMFFHTTLDDNKHTEEQVKAVINLFPDSLSQVDEEYGVLPIQTAPTYIQTYHKNTIHPCIANRNNKSTVLW